MLSLSLYCVFSWDVVDVGFPTCLSNGYPQVFCSHFSLTWQPCLAALPGSLAWQPCLAALPGSLAWQPCLAALPGSLAW
jgi:hypothetical protein